MDVDEAETAGSKSRLLFSTGREGVAGGLSDCSEVKEGPADANVGADELDSDGAPSRSDHGEGRGKAVGVRRGKVLDGDGGTDEDVDGDTGVAGCTEGMTGVVMVAKGMCSSM